MSVDSVDSDIPADETLLERIAALKDIVPPTTRHNIATKLSASGSFLKRSGKVVGNIVWVLTTSALLVGLPMALSLEGEAAVIEQEKAMLAQGGGQVRLSDIIYVDASSHPVDDARWRSVPTTIRWPSSCTRWTRRSCPPGILSKTHYSLCGPTLTGHFLMYSMPAIQVILNHHHLHVTYFANLQA